MDMRGSQPGDGGSSERATGNTARLNVIAQWSRAATGPLLGWHFRRCDVRNQAMTLLDAATPDRAVGTPTPPETLATLQAARALLGEASD